MGKGVLAGDHGDGRLLLYGQEHGIAQRLAMPTRRSGEAAEAATALGRL